MLGESAYQNHSEHGLIIHNHTWFVILLA
jgi:hypothetical protein